MGHGGFGEVVAFTWHGQQAAYKVVPVFGNTKLELEKQKKMKRVAMHAINKLMFGNETLVNGQKL